MERRAVGLCAVICALLVVVWGTISAAPDGTRSPDAEHPAAGSAWPASSDRLAGQRASPWWERAAASELAPTGIELVNAYGVDSIVVDGTGAVWVDGAWQLSRVDPATGSAQTWDVSDDVIFATLWKIRPSAGAGVWLITSDRLRLFDGRRFVRDLAVPAAYRGTNDVVEVGTEVWVSGASGVARCTQGGAWSLVGEATITGAGVLTVDSEGYVWTVGQVEQEGESSHAVVRFDGARWSTPGGAEAPTFAEDIVADPTGGVRTRFGFGVRAFDGTSWRRIPRLPAVRGADGLLSLVMAVTPDGVLWVVGPDGLSHHEAVGGWKTVTRAGGSSLVGLGIVATDVIVADSSGLLRLEGGQLRRVWAHPGPGLSAPVEGLLAVSSDEVWATGERGVQQFLDGRWRRRWAGPGWQAAWWMEWGSGAGLTLATDEVVWAIVDVGLARFQGDQSVVLARDHPDGWLQAGPDSAVWALGAMWSGWSGWYAGPDLDGTSLSLVGADGTRTSVRLPGPAWSVTSLAAGVDGSIWVTICEEDVADYCTVPSLMRWEGSWSPVPYPGAGVRGVAVAPDGGLWALLTTGVSANEMPFVARYAEGSWTQFPDATNLGWLTPAPGGRICGVDMSASALVCIDPSGRMSRASLAVPGHVHIGADGSLWLEESGVVARLPGTAPG